MLNSKVPESEHLGAGSPRVSTLALEVSAKSQGVSTCALEVSARSRRSLRVWALGSGKSQRATTWAREASEFKYLRTGSLGV